MAWRPTDSHRPAPPKVTHVRRTRSPPAPVPPPILPPPCPAPGPAAFATVEPATDGPLVDPQGRRLDYLRLAVTDHCNLRCRYCMPAAGVALGERDEVLSIDELIRVGALPRASACEA